MATFDIRSNTLPDPDIKLTDAGNISASGTPGPGFSSLNFRSNEDAELSRTKSGRGVGRSSGTHYWSFSIKYNPMFREQFEIVDAFLALRNPRIDAFYVSLPQYYYPRDPIFKVFAQNNTIKVLNDAKAGDRTITVECQNNIDGKSRPGDMLTFSDPEDANHQKVYKIGAIENHDLSQQGLVVPSYNRMRLHLSPLLQRDITAGAVINFIKPKFRVVTTSPVRENELSTDNLYQFSLDLEELQP